MIDGHFLYMCHPDVDKKIFH